MPPIQPARDPGVPSHVPSRRLGAALVAIVLVLAGCGDGGSSLGPSVTASAPTAAPSVATSTGPSAPPTGPPTVGLAELDPLEISLQGGPDFPVALDGSIWILAPDGPRGGGEEEPVVYRLDIATGEEQAVIPIDGRLCQGLAAGFGSVWACTDAGLARIDPATNEVAATVPFDVAQAFARPAIGADRVWMLGGNVRPDAVVEIDPATFAVVATHPIGHVGGTLAFGGGALWITVPADGLVLRLDPATGDVSEHASSLPAPAAIAFGAESVWVALYGEHGGERAGTGEGTIARLSAEDGSVEATIFINSPTMAEGDIWASDEAVWVRSPSDPFLVRIDPASNEVDFAIAGFHSGGALTLAEGVIWTTSIEFATAWRIEP
jgi:hypothetical protein